MKLNKDVIVMIVAMLAAITILPFPFYILEELLDIESEVFLFVYYIVAGLLLGLLVRYVLKRKYPDVLHRQKIESKDERNIVIRDRTGYKTLLYFSTALIISYFVYQIFDIEYDYSHLIPLILVSGWLMYAVLYYYYQKRF